MFYENFSTAGIYIGVLGHDVSQNGDGTYNENNYNIFKDIVDPDLSINALVDYEKTRLDLKGNVITVEYETKIRRDQQLRSATARKNAYYKMLMVVVIMFIVSLGLFLLQRYLPIIPELVTDLLIMAIVASGLIYLLTLYMDILKRDRLDFEKIDFASLLKAERDSKKKIEDEGIAISQLSSDISSGVCIGADCCSLGNIFVDNQCVKVEAFTLLNINDRIEPFRVMPDFSSY